MNSCATGFESRARDLATTAESLRLTSGLCPPRWRLPLRPASAVMAAVRHNAGPASASPPSRCRCAAPDAAAAAAPPPQWPSRRPARRTRRSIAPARRPAAKARCHTPERRRPWRRGSEASCDTCEGKMYFNV